MSLCDGCLCANWNQNVQTIPATATAEQPRPQKCNSLPGLALKYEGTNLLMWLLVMVSIKVRRNCSVNELCLLPPRQSSPCSRRGPGTGRAAGFVQRHHKPLPVGTVWALGLPLRCSGAQGWVCSPCSPCPPWQEGVERRRRRRRVVQDRQKGESWPGAIQGFVFAAGSSQQHDPCKENPQ